MIDALLGRFDDGLVLCIVGMYASLCVVLLLFLFLRFEFDFGCGLTDVLCRSKPGNCLWLGSLKTFEAGRLETRLLQCRGLRGRQCWRILSGNSV